MWLVVTGHEIVGYPGSVEAQMKLAVAALAGAAIIMAIGLGIQLAVNRVARMSR